MGGAFDLPMQGTVMLHNGHLTTPSINAEECDPRRQSSPFHKVGYPHFCYMYTGRHKEMHVVTASFV